LINGWLAGKGPVPWWFHSTKASRIPPLPARFWIACARRFFSEGWTCFRILARPRKRLGIGALMDGRSRLARGKHRSWLHSCARRWDVTPNRSPKCDVIYFCSEVMRTNNLTSSRFEILHHAAKEDGVGFAFPPASNAPAGIE